MSAPLQLDAEVDGIGQNHQCPKNAHGLRIHQSGHLELDTIPGMCYPTSWQTGHVQLSTLGQRKAQQKATTKSHPKGTRTCSARSKARNPLRSWLCEPSFAKASWAPGQTDPKETAPKTHVYVALTLHLENMCIHLYIYIYGLVNFSGPPGKQFMFNHLIQMYQTLQLFI